MLIYLKYFILQIFYVHCVFRSLIYINPSGGESPVVLPEEHRPVYIPVALWADPCVGV